MERPLIFVTNSLLTPLVIPEVVTEGIQQILLNDSVLHSGDIAMNDQTMDTELHSHGAYIFYKHFL